MSGSNTNWAALTSDNERLAGTTADLEAATATPGPAPSRWADLASQRERLVNTGESLGGLASSRPRTSELRLAVKAA